NPGIATAGSGDVLTGVITALLGMGKTPLEAAKLAVYAHGKAGDYCEEQIGQMGMTASNIVAALPAVWQELTK
ncbi:MAG: NAD(P)H-hydrate dehydratase, partial [Anaerovoracaceae bacterium]